MRSHSDYVTCMAASQPAGLLASGALRGEVMLWDIGTLQKVLQTPQVSALCSTQTELVACGGCALLPMTWSAPCKLQHAGGSLPRSPVCQDAPAACTPPA